MTSEGEVTYVTTLAALDTRPVRILALFSGTGSVEKEFARCFPASRSVTLDADPLWRPTHVTDIESWDYWRYPPGYFDVVWASPPCTQYIQAHTTGGTRMQAANAEVQAQETKVSCVLEDRLGMKEQQLNEKLSPDMRLLPADVGPRRVVKGDKFQPWQAISLREMMLEEKDLFLYMPDQVDWGRQDKLSEAVKIFMPGRQRGKFVANMGVFVAKGFFVAIRDFLSPRQNVFPGDILSPWNKMSLGETFYLSPWRQTAIMWGKCVTMAGKRN
ncbi:hypothetical protein CYMTET_40993 [Cymbomonas tetramitiformis]|uniref:Uncharacterized protein n=1 Tax=Cymbomonas tetramitiformis TaxID=36881 RepID=A0AAE0C8R5_9CHLO|nr:hypothetical protein CYMTET_40993 [Cymbomonas tetramitiformis]